MTKAWALVGLLSVAFVLNYMDRQVVFAIFPLLRRDMAFSETQLGLAGSLFTWTYSAMMPISGRLADLFPRNRLVVASLILWSVATFGTGLSRNVPEFLTSRVLMGLSESLYVPAAMALITGAHSSATRSRALAAHGFAQFTGITLGAWFGGWVGETYGWRLGLQALAAVGILYSIVLVKFLHDPSRATGNKLERKASPREVLVSTFYWIMALTFFCFCAMLWMLYAWLPTFIYDTYKLSLADSGLTATLFLQSSSALGVLVGGTLGDYFGKRSTLGRFRVLCAGLFFAAPFAFATFSGQSLLLLKISACGFGLFSGLFISNIFATVYDIVAAENYGFGVGLINMVGGLGAGAAILLTGMLKEWVPISSLMLSGTIASMAMAIVLAGVSHAQMSRPVTRLAENS